MGFEILTMSSAFTVDNAVWQKLLNWGRRTSMKSPWILFVFLLCQPLFAVTLNCDLSACQADACKKLQSYRPVLLGTDRKSLVFEDAEFSVETLEDEPKSVAISAAGVTSRAKAIALGMRPKSMALMTELSGLPSGVSYEMECIFPMPEKYQPLIILE